MSVKFDGLDEKSQILIKLAISASNEPILKILDIIPMFFGVRNSMDTLSKPKNCLKIPQIRFIAILEPWNRPKYIFLRWLAASFDYMS